MYCIKCGAENEDGVAFCTKCGEKMTASAEFTKGQDNPEKSTKAAETVELTAIKEIKKLSPKSIKIIAAGALLLAVAVVAVVISGKTIRMSDYFQVEFQGYDTVGRASAHFDQEAFLADFNKKAKSKQTVQELAANLFDYYNEDVFDYIDWELSANNKLSNDDKIDLTWQINTDKIKDLYGVRIVAKDETLTVSGLEPVTTFNPFENGVEVLFSGTEPNGTISVYPTAASNDSIYDYLSFEPEKTSGFVNGDTVTVYLSINNYYGNDLEEYCAETYGKIPTETSKTFTVEGLDSYVTSAAQVTAETLEAMKNQAVDVIKEMTANFKTGITLEKMDCVGYYMLFPKDIRNVNKNLGAGNSVFLVYRLTAKFSNDESSDSKQYYVFVRFRDISVDKAGNCSVELLDYATPRTSFYYNSTVKSGWSSLSGSFYGYETLDELRKANVDAYLGTYTYETNIA